jgi:hypothetical protein
MAFPLYFPQELLAIQQSDGPKNVGFFGTRNMGVTHQKLVEILSYAYASTVRGCILVIIRHLMQPAEHSIRLSLCHLAQQK